MSSTPVLAGLAAAGGVSLSAWLGILADPRRPWDLEPVGEVLMPPAPSAGRL